MPGYQVGAVASHRVFHMHPLRWKREAGESEKLEDALLWRWTNGPQGKDCGPTLLRASKNEPAGPQSRPGRLWTQVVRRQYMCITTATGNRDGEDTDKPLSFRSAHSPQSGRRRWLLQRGRSEDKAPAQRTRLCPHNRACRGHRPAFPCYTESVCLNSLSGTAFIACILTRGMKSAA